MHYIIYQITNKINGKTYIGKHKTKDINDNYMGSGTALKLAQRKYGLKNFEKTILFECQSESEMNKMEAQLVSQAFVDRKDTYNLMLGGTGGWDYINSHPQLIPCHGYRFINEHGLNNKVDQCHAVRRKIAEDPEYAKRFSQKVKDGQAKSKSHQRNLTNRKKANNPMFGRHHTDEAKKKMSESHSGEKNSMAGKQWIYSEELQQSKPILKTDPIPEGWKPGRFYPNRHVCADCKKPLKDSRIILCRKCRNKRNTEKAFAEHDFIHLAKRLFETHNMSEVARENNTLPSVIQKWFKTARLPYKLDSIIEWYKTQVGE